ncbi:MAG: hypothetical protein ACJATT_003923 [Myxococcota bacterium]|jgi:hypothetical protein
MHNRTENQHTTRVNVRRSTGEWEPILAAFPAYYDIGIDGFPGWRAPFYLNQYKRAAIPLTDHVGRQVELCIAFTSDHRTVERGMDIDDIGMNDVSSAQTATVSSV